MQPDCEPNVMPLKPWQAEDNLILWTPSLKVIGKYIIEKKYKIKIVFDYLEFGYKIKEIKVRRLDYSKKKNMTSGFVQSIIYHIDLFVFLDCRLNMSFFYVLKCKAIICRFGLNKAKRLPLIILRIWLRYDSWLVKRIYRSKIFCKKWLINLFSPILNIIYFLFC